MYQRSALALIVSLCISGWLSACDSTSHVDSVEPQDSANTITDVVSNDAVETPKQPTAPALPPPVSIESFLGEAHQHYADFIGTPKGNVEKCWIASGHASPFEYTDVAFLNGFFKFNLCADFEIEISLEKVKGLVKQAHDDLKAGDLPGFRSAIQALTLENQSIRARILKAASYYQVPLAQYQYSPSDKGDNFASFNIATQNIFTQIPKPKGVIFLDDTVMEDVQTLVLSVSLLFNASGTSYLISFENFDTADTTFPLLNTLFTFESGQGGFGITNTQEIRFSAP